MRRAWRTTARIAAAASLALLASGCTELVYYWQSATGHMELMRAARPVDDVLEDADASQALRDRLRLTQRIRAYAVSELGLPDNASYRVYADLKRPAVVWNVVAAPELSLELKTWCFPVTGCVGYRGYFREADARQMARELEVEKLEVSVYGVPAYSTLGWFSDPLLNTFIDYPEGELARLIFHELAHQMVFAAGDTVFNESFATAVERLGGARWLASQGSAQARAEFAQSEARRLAFRSLTLATRARLAAIYEEKAPGQRTSAEKLAMKKRAMLEFREAWAKLKAEWGGDPSEYRGYDAWVSRANNAAFGAQAAYDDLVPAFEALFRREGESWTRFYAAARKLAELPYDQRRIALKETPGG